MLRIRHTARERNEPGQRASCAGDEGEDEKGAERMGRAEPVSMRCTLSLHRAAAFPGSGGQSAIDPQQRASLLVEPPSVVHDESALACVLDFKALAVLGVLDVPDLQAHARRDRHEQPSVAAPPRQSRRVLVHRDSHVCVEDAHRLATTSGCEGRSEECPGERACELHRAVATRERMRCIPRRRTQLGMARRVISEARSTQSVKSPTTCTAQHAS